MTVAGERLRRVLESSGLAWPAYLGSILTGMLVAAAILAVAGRLF